MTQEAYPEAAVLARRALEIDEHLGPAHRLLGELAFYHTYDWATAGNEFHRAVELEPDSAEAHNDLARFLASSNRFDQAHDEPAQARRLAPQDAGMAYLEGQLLYFQRRFREAVTLDRRVLAELHARYVTMLGESRLPVRATHETDRLETLLNPVAAGRGATLVPDWAEELNVEGVVYRRLPGPGRSVAIGAVVARRGTGPRLLPALG